MKTPAASPPAGAAKPGRAIEVRNPRSGAYDYRFVAPSRDELAELAERLRAAQHQWQSAGVKHRIEVLGRWRKALKQATPAVVSALATDTGRIALAHQEAGGLAAGIERGSTLASELMQQGERPAAAMPQVGIRAQRVPYPLLVAISPWNFPLLLAFIDAIPALLAGSAVIVKPSEVTPRFIEPVMATVRSVPELAEVLALVPGDGGTGAALVELADVVAFTGSVATGRRIAEAAARRFIPAFLELGGKDPAIVLEGADLERAATSLLRASVAATGQACQSIERIYVARAVHDEFVELLTAKARAVELAYPDPGSGVLGPLIFERQAEVIERHLADAVSKGAAVRCGGAVLALGGGKWIEPTVLTGVDHGMLVMREETFGPLMPVMAFDTADEAVALANDSAYGLSASVFGPDEASAIAVAERLEAGGVSVNDAGLTTMIFEAEKSAFRFSGMGPSRMGPSGFLRFFRSKTLYVNRGDVLPLEAMREDGPER